MFCPNDECPDYLNTSLRSEYRDDMIRCPFCETPLVVEPPPIGGPGDVNDPPKPRVGDDETMEPVLESTDLTEVAIIKSVLDSARIPFITQGEDQFGAFRATFLGGSIFNPRSRGVVFTVPSRFVEEARHLLEEFEEDPDTVGD